MIRENVVRHVDDTFSVANALNQGARGFLADSVANGLIEQNVIDVEDPYPIIRKYNQTVKCFNNRNGSGLLLQAIRDVVSEDVNYHDSELAALIDDVLVAAL